jgi:hypothetical protein
MLEIELNFKEAFQISIRNSLSIGNPNLIPSLNTHTIFEI